jgi:hypothetical protein
MKRLKITKSTAGPECAGIEEKIKGDKLSNQFLHQYQRKK